MTDSSSLQHWHRPHTIAVIVVTALFVWMAVRLPIGLFPSWIATLSALAAFALIVGQGVTGVWKGAFVDDRLRMSLSRLQMLTWTVVIVSAFGTIAIARAQQNAITALDVAVPSAVWLLLGISTTSLVGSPLIRDLKKDSSKAPPVAKSAELVKEQGRAPESVAADGQFMKNRSIADATFADLFMGELIEDFALLDVAKIQMFFFTILAVLFYATAIGASLRSGVKPTSLPDVGEGVLAILGISHGGYLMSKAAASPKAGQP